VPAQRLPLPLPRCRVPETHAETSCGECGAAAGARRVWLLSTWAGRPLRRPGAPRGAGDGRASYETPSSRRCAVRSHALPSRSASDRHPCTLMASLVLHPLVSDTSDCIWRAQIAVQIEIQGLKELESGSRCTQLRCRRSPTKRCVVRQRHHASLSTCSPNHLELFFG
jgi:hypothetical protein